LNTFFSILDRIVSLEVFEF